MRPRSGQGSIGAIKVVATQNEELESATLPAAVLASFSNDLNEMGQAVFAPALAGPVAEVLAPGKAVFVVIKYSLASA